MDIFVYDYETGKFKKEPVLMFLKYKSLQKSRKEYEGVGIAAIYKESSTDTFYLVSLEDRSVPTAASYEGDKAKYIYDNIQKYPKDTALTINYFKFKVLNEDSMDLAKVFLDAYNVSELISFTRNKKEWKSMNKTEFTSWKKQKGI